MAGSGRAGPRSLRPGGVSLKLIYIMGYGRSGSTLLDVILGNSKAITSVGELGNLVHAGWTNDEYCACGKRAKECLFWTAVQHNWRQRSGSSVDDFRRVEQHQERSILRWVRALSRGGGASVETQTHQSYLMAVLEAIVSAGRRSVIVDSSKEPLRALLLSRLPGIRLKLIHLVRDVRGVAWSLSKSFKKDERLGLQHAIVGRGAWSTSLRWRAKNLQAEYVRRQVKPTEYLLLRYEDLMQRPREMLTRVGEFVEQDLEPEVQKLERGDAFTIGCNIAGNRIRMHQSIRLQPDFEWREQMGGFQRRVAKLGGGRLMQAYGYES